MSDRDLVQIILALREEVRSLRRSVQGMQRFGTVHAVDGESRRVQLRLAGENGSEFLSPKRPWADFAGDEKSWRPPSEGQQMLMLSPFGDMRQGVAVPLTFSNANPAPSSALDARILSAFGGGLIGFTNGGGEAQMFADRVDLGAPGGKRVARVGDRVHVQSGSSTGFWPIVEGSDKVYAA